MVKKKELSRKQVRNILRRESKRKINMNNENNQKIKIAVYGTLCRGYQGNIKYLKDAEYLGSFDTKPEFNMYDLKHYPGVVKNGNTSIRMEVFEVKNSMISVFDKIEGYSENKKMSQQNVFERSLIMTPYGEAYVYLYANLKNNVNTPKTVDCGDWQLN